MKPPAEELPPPKAGAEKSTRLKRTLSCNVCPPNKGENRKRRPKHRK